MASSVSVADLTTGLRTTTSAMVQACLRGTSKQMVVYRASCAIRCVAYHAVVNDLAMPHLPSVVRDAEHVATVMSCVTKLWLRIILSPVSSEHVTQACLAAAALFQ